MAAKSLLTTAALGLLLFCRTASLPGSPAGAQDPPRPVDVADVRWTEGFWAEKFDLCLREIIPAVERALLDPANSEHLVNFRIAAGLSEGPFRSRDWSDGDCHKWLEALAYAFAVTRDPALDRKMDEWIAVIARGQAPDGYLSTNIQIDPRKDRWQSVQHHALYNMGHLITAACAHHRATGKDSFLKVAVRAADYLHKTFSPRPPELAHMDFNPSQMMALVDLYRATGRRKYLDLADTFVSMRGSRPATAEEGRNPRHRGGTDLTQDRVPLRQETVAVGHAVTAAYLWCGAADLCAETGEAALRDALLRLWKDVTGKRMSITGAVGSLAHGFSTRGDSVHEAFGADYALPNRTVYNETCANVGNAMWNQRMLGLTGDARHADVMETVLYNSMLSAVSLDGGKFFYGNPLAWDGSPKPVGKHQTSVRAHLLDCYCCPPQVARTIAGLGRWAYGVSAGALWTHLYGGNRLDTTLPDGSAVALSQETRYPWEGRVKLTFEKAPGKEMALMLRIPGWAEGASVRVNGRPPGAAIRPAAYLSVRRTWTAGDTVEIEFPLEARLVEAHPRVQECLHRAAVVRGPVVYCLELPANEENGALRSRGLYLPEHARLTPRFEKDLLGGVTVLDGRALTREEKDRLPPGTAADIGDGDIRLYRPLKARLSGTAAEGSVDIRLIPYFAWANRGVPFMDVWIPLARKESP